MKAFEASDANGIDLRDITDRFISSAPQIEDGAVLVLLSGQFVTSGQESWLLSVDAPETPELSAMPREALPISTIMSVFAAHPGKAVLAIASSAPRTRALPHFLNGGMVRSLRRKA